MWVLLPSNLVDWVDVWIVLKNRSNYVTVSAFWCNDKRCPGVLKKRIHMMIPNTYRVYIFWWRHTPFLRCRRSLRLQEVCRRCHDIPSVTPRLAEWYRTCPKCWPLHREKEVGWLSPRDLDLLPTSNTTCDAIKEDEEMTLTNWNQSVIISETSP